MIDVITIKARWIAKLTRAKFFIVLTDKESIVALDGIDPRKTDDVLALMAQQTEIREFQESLKKLQKEHDAAINKLLGRSGGDTPKRKKVTKIEVKEG